VHSDTHATLKEKEPPPHTGNELLNRSMLWSLNDNEIQTTHQNDSAMHSATILAEKNFQALPVRGEKRKLLGFLDILDCCVALEKVTPDTINAGKPLFSGTVKDVSNISGRNAWHPMDSHAPLRRVLLEMAKNRIYRIPVMDLDNCVALVTQSDILGYIAKNLHLWPHLSSIALKHENLSTKSEVVSGRDDMTALEAFHVLGKSRKGGIAIVNKDGKLVSELSGRDILRAIKDPKTLLLPVLEYLSARPDSRAPIILRPGASLRETITTIVEHQKHRAFVVDKHGNLKGLVSIIDLLRVFINEELK